MSNKNSAEINKCEKKKKSNYKKQTSKSPVQDANCDGHQGPAFRTNISGTKQKSESFYKH